MRHLIVVRCADTQVPGRKRNLSNQQIRPITVCSTTPAFLLCAGRLRAPPAGGDAEGGGGARQAGRGGLCRGAAGRAQDARRELRLRRAGGRSPTMQSCCAQVPPVWFLLKDRLHSGYDALVAVSGGYSRPLLQCCRLILTNKKDRLLSFSCCPGGYHLTATGVLLLPNATASKNRS